MLYLYALITNQEVPKQSVCQEHSYINIITPYKEDIQYIEKSLEPWLKRGHGYSNSDSYGHIVIKQDIRDIRIYEYEYDLPFGSLSGITFPYEENCIISVQDITNVLVLQHELGHCFCYDDLYSDIWKNHVMYYAGLPKKNYIWTQTNVHRLFK